MGVELSEKHWKHLPLQVVPISGLAHGLLVATMASALKFLVASNYLITINSLTHSLM